MDSEKIFNLIKEKDKKIVKLFEDLSEVFSPEEISVFEKLTALYVPLLLKAIEYEGLEKNLAISFSQILLTLVTVEVALEEEVMGELSEDIENKENSLEEALKWMQEKEDSTNDGKEPEPFEPN